MWGEPVQCRPVWLLQGPRVVGGWGRRRAAVSKRRILLRCAQARLPQMMGTCGSRVYRSAYGPGQLLAEPGRHLGAVTGVNAGEQPVELLEIRGDRDTGQSPLRGLAGLRRARGLVTPVTEVSDDSLQIGLDSRDRHDIGGFSRRQVPPAQDKGVIRVLLV